MKDEDEAMTALSKIVTAAGALDEDTVKDISWLTNVVGELKDRIDGMSYDYYLQFRENKRRVTWQELDMDTPQFADNPKVVESSTMDQIRTFYLKLMSLYEKAGMPRPLVDIERVHKVTEEVEILAGE